MKKLLIFQITLLLVLGSSFVAYAIPYSDLYDAGGIDMHGWIIGGDTVTWTFDITDDGFNPNTQDVTEASIALSFSDSQNLWDWSEYAYLNVGNNNFFWEVNSGETSFSISSLMTLSDTGKVDATLTAVWGDFKFHSALLTAEGSLPDISASPVPEPAAILLFGTGLVGLSFATRRKLHIEN